MATSMEESIKNALSFRVCCTYIHDIAFSYAALRVIFGPEGVIKGFFDFTGNEI